MTRPHCPHDTDSATGTSQLHSPPTPPPPPSTAGLRERGAPEQRAVTAKLGEPAGREAKALKWRRESLGQAAFNFSRIGAASPCTAMQENAVRTVPVSVHPRQFPATQGVQTEIVDEA